MNWKKAGNNIHHWELRGTAGELIAEVEREDVGTWRWSCYVMPPAHGVEPDRRAAQKRCAVNGAVTLNGALSNGKG